MKFSDLGRCEKCRHPKIKWRDWPYFWRKKWICTNCGEDTPINYHPAPYGSCVYAGRCNHTDGPDCPGDGSKCAVSKAFDEEIN